MQLVFCRRAMFYERCSLVAVVSVSATHGLVRVCLALGQPKVRNCTCSGSNDNIFVRTTGWFIVLHMPECWCHNISIFVDLLAWEMLVFLTSRFEAILVTYYTSTYLLDWIVVYHKQGYSKIIERAAEHSMQAAVEVQALAEYAEKGEVQAQIHLCRVHIFLSPWIISGMLGMILLPMRVIQLCLACLEGT